MTNIKLRRLKKLAKELIKIAPFLSHDIETLIMGAELKPHTAEGRIVEDGRFTKALKKIHESLRGQNYALIGGLAVQHWVSVRPTNDIDIVLLASDLIDVKTLFPNGSETALVYYVKIEGTLVDFMHSQIFPWTQDAIKSAVQKSDTGTSIPVVLPEYLILYKMHAARQRDLEDVKDLLKNNKVYGKARKLVHQYFTPEDLEDFEQLAREAEFGV